VERRVLGLVQIYQPAVLVIEEPTRVRLAASPALSGIVERIRAIAVGAGLRFVKVNPLTVRERLCGSARATRREVVEQLVERYPHLARYVDGASQWQKEYWLPMFAAVGVGITVGRTDKTGLDG